MKTSGLTLGKAQRLKSRKAIDQLFTGGKSFMVPPVRVVYAIGTQPGNQALQAGFGVSTRYFKKATQRNRIKRLLRECWRLQKEPLEQQLLANGCNLRLFILFASSHLPTYEELYPKLAIVVNKLRQLKYEKNAPLA